MTARVDLHGVTYRYPDAGDDAVTDLHLAVDADETVCVLGASGSGKSTMLRLVAGLEKPTAGTVLFDGVDQRDVPPHRRDAAMLFQDYALFPHRDVGGNVAYGLEARRVPRSEVRRRVADVLAAVGLADWQDRRVGSLSGGEAQRVALARALVVDPAVLLLDEPLGALDRAWRDDLVARFRRTFDGRCVLYVTHDQAEALALADRVAVMHGGRIVQCGTTEDVWGAPATASVARILGMTGLHDAVLSDAGTDRQRLRLPWCETVLPSTGLPVGDVTVLVRPTAWKLTDIDDDDPALGSAAHGVVVDDRFAGDHRRLAVELRRTDGRAAGPDLVDVDVPTSTVSHAGADVALVVDPAGVTVLAT